MICFFIANQIDLEAHSSDNDAQAQKMSFKAKMLRLFILLVTIDLLALIINFVFELVPSLYTPDIQIAVFAWTADFIYPFHILVMFTLLSMFKEEVLRKKQAKNITISKTSIGGVGHERDQKEVVSDDGSKIQSTAG